MKHFLYLIQGPTSFKVGRTSNPQRRKKTYATHNPEALWLCEIEVSDSFLLEKAFHDFLARRFPVVPGAKEWFRGSLSEKIFHELLDHFDPSEPEVPILQNFQHYFEAQGIPHFQLLVDDALYNGGHEWSEYLVLSYNKDSDTHCTIQLVDATSHILLTLCADVDMSLQDLLELLDNGEIDPVLEFNSEGYSAKDLLRGPIVLTHGPKEL